MIVEEHPVDLVEEIETDFAVAPPTEPESPTPVQVSSPVETQSAKRNGPAHLIRLPGENICLDDTESNLIVSLNRRMDYKGRLTVTNFRVQFCREEDNEEPILAIPIGYIANIEKRFDQAIMSHLLELFLKNGMTVKLRFPENKLQQCAREHAILNKIIESSQQFPFEYGKATKTTAEFLISEPVAMEGAIDNRGGQHAGYPYWFRPADPSNLPSFPQRIILLSFETIRKNRIWRNGPGTVDPGQQSVLSQLKRDKSVEIYEVQAGRMASSKNILERQYIELDNAVMLKDSYQKMLQLCQVNNDVQKWIAAMQSVRWVGQVAQLIREAQKMATRLLDQKKSFIILSESQSRCGQLSGLIQLIIDPTARTVDGYNQLIETEFLQYGNCRSSRRDRDQDKSIYLLQFFDCTYQLQHHFPFNFEFNDRYLQFLAEHIHSNLYGNFLLLTKGIKVKMVCNNQFLKGLVRQYFGNIQIGLLFIKIFLNNYQISFTNYLIGLTNIILIQEQQRRSLIGQTHCIFSSIKSIISNSSAYLSIPSTLPISSTPLPSIPPLLNGYYRSPDKNIIFDLIAPVTARVVNIWRAYFMAKIGLGGIIGIINQHCNNNSSSNGVQSVTQNSHVIQNNSLIQNNENPPNSMITYNTHTLTYDPTSPEIAYYLLKKQVEIKRDKLLSNNKTIAHLRDNIKWMQQNVVL